MTDPTQRFATRADAYVAARPRYPERVVGLIESAVGIATGSVIADVGSGTGLSAEPFLRRGYSVSCVEPNDAMRVAAERLLQHYAGFRSVAGTAEHTTLPAASIDCVIVAQAFHWFDAPAARAEFARITRDGTVVLMWHSRRLDGSSFLRAYETLLRTFGTDYDRVRERTERVMSDVELRRFFTAGYERHAIDSHQDLDLAALQSRVTSASYMPNEGSPAYRPMMDAMERLFAQESRAGSVRLEYDLEVYCGRVAVPA